MATRKVVEQKQPGALIMSQGDGLGIFVTGAVVGIVAVVLYVLLDKYLFTPTLCSETLRVAGRCANKLNFASALAMVLVALGALVALVHRRVFRPLLVVFAVTVALWNTLQLTASLPWWGSVLLMALVFGLAYLLFAWVVQVRDFIVALVLSVVLVVVIRLMLY